MSANPNLKIYDRQQQKLQPWVRTYATYGLSIQLKQIQMLISYSFELCRFNKCNL